MCALGGQKVGIFVTVGRLLKMGSGEYITTLDRQRQYGYFQGFTARKLCGANNWDGYGLGWVGGHSGLLTFGILIFGVECSGFWMFGVQICFQTFGVFGVFAFRTFGVEPRT